MHKQRFAVILTTVALCLLTACGGNTDSSAMAQQEIQALQEQLAAAEARCAALQADNDALTAQNTAAEQTPEQSDCTMPIHETRDPIEDFFSTVEIGSSTAEQNFVADSRANAWEAEARNMAAWLKQQLPLQEDQALVDAYIATAEEQVSRLVTMAIYPIADLETPQSERVMSSGTLRGVLWADSRSQLWQDTFYQLQAVAPVFDAYVFCFDADAMQTQLTGALTNN